MKNCEFKRLNDGFKCINCGFFIRGEFPDGIFKNCAKPPSVIQTMVNKTENVTEAIGSVITEGPIEPEYQKDRIKICEGCEHYDHGRCKLCSCFMPLKTRVRNMNCPIGKW